MASHPKPRIVARTRAEHLRRRNLDVAWHHDLYHRALTLRWWSFLLAGCVAYLGINVVFALLYLLQPGSIQGAQPGFSDAFFFSIQTIATIGYGLMSPGTFYCNLLVTLETMTGLVFVALATGITFARISRPTARVMFARTMIVDDFDGSRTLSVRLANERRSQILEADVALTMLRYERSREGHEMRRFYNLPLVRAHTPVFALSFTVMHVIDEQSPFWEATAESLAAENAELLLSVTGLEEITSQTVHARYVYEPEQIRFGHRYVDIFVEDEVGRLIDYGRFHETYDAKKGQGAALDREGDGYPLPP
jgi:inward rectifier potassium channel